MVSRFKFVLLLAVAAFLPAEQIMAQDATLTGTVRNTAGTPVAGAFVTVQPLDLSTMTSASGDYRIDVPAAQVAGQQVTIRATLIGFRPAEATIASLSSGVTRTDLTLREEAIALDQIVVTGTAGRQARRAQAAVVGSIDASAVMEVAPVTSVRHLLQARMPGVSVQGGGGTMGGTQVIRMRGQASLTLSNQPLVFIDGVRADDSHHQIYGVGGTVSSRLNDIRPEDIEDIEVVKGPAASTLYGADASAGVIHIITKRGRDGAGFTQTVTAEYHRLDWDHWDLPLNFGLCGQAHVDNPNHLYCAGQAVGTMVSDQPLIRYDALQTGSRTALNWSGRGGGANHAYYMSLGGDQAEGVFSNNRTQNISGRTNFEFQPIESLRLDAGVGFARQRTQMPQNDNNIYGFLGGGLLGNPLSAGHDSRDGWYAPNRQVDAITAIQNYNTNIRATPRLTVNYSPTAWMTNRLTLGGDLGRVEANYYYPLNDNGWYAGVLNTGQAGQARQNRDRLTLDYMGNISHFLTPDVSSDISFGTQVIHNRFTMVNATGIGFVTNAANAISQAAENIGSQNFSENRQIGFFGQWQVGYRDRLYVQVAGRVDEHSAFGADSDPFFSPKVGVSYVISDEDFWQDIMPAQIGQVRLRAAWGTTGRAPTTGAVSTYGSSAYSLMDGSVRPGVIAARPGNPELKPERGTEIEAGFEAALFDDRLGLEVTYFDKTSRDVILSRPLPPSDGFAQNRLVNIGELVNSGFEVSANARVLTLPDFGWEVRLGFSTLSSEVTDLGGISPFATGWSQEVREGFEPNAFFTREVVEFSTDAAICPTDGDGNVIPCGIVTDEPVFRGNYLPDFEGNLSQTFTIMRNLRVYALLDWKSNFYLYNNTDQFRERQFGIGELFVRCGSTNPATREARGCTLSDEERIRRYGPFRTADGGAVGAGVVDDAYVEAGDFVRLRELSATYNLPGDWAGRMGATSASVTLGGSNLWLSTDYSGADPEIGLYLHADRREDFLTVPQERRLFARVNFSF